MIIINLGFILDEDFKDANFVDEVDQDYFMNDYCGFRDGVGEYECYDFVILTEVV